MHPSGVRICFFCGCSRGSVAPVSAAVQLRRGRSPLHHRAILWRPSGAHKFGGHAPANMAFLRTDVLRMGYATRMPFR